MKTLEEVADFLEQHVIDCEENTGCGRCDDVRKCVQILRNSSTQKNELGVGVVSKSFCDYDGNTCHILKMGEQND